MIYILTYFKVAENMLKIHVEEKKSSVKVDEGEVKMNQYKLT